MAESIKSRAVRGIETVLKFFRSKEPLKRDNLRDTLGSLRRTPASDREKKRELAAFFQTEEGRRYSPNRRRQAYEELLGESRNNRQRG